MDRTLRKELERWLAAEAAGDETAAERAFGAVFARMPRLHPAPGFAERVVWAAAPGSVRRPVLELWGGRFALALSLSLAALAVGLLPSLSLLPVEAPSLAALLQAGNDLLSWFGGRLGAGLAVWSFLSRIGAAISIAIATPQAASALLGSATLSGLALYTLNRMLTPERRIR